MVYHSATLDATFGALADPTRRAILQRLSRGEETIGHLAGRFTMSLPAVSKHLRVLERAGLVRVRREGRVRHTALVAAPMKRAASWIDQYRRFWEHQFDKLEQYLESTANEDAPWPAPAPAPQSPPSKSAGRSARRASGSSPRGRGRSNSRSGRRRGR